ncbi:MAG: polynucleotide adenylyltransferase PcnB [Deltaproteobacteria bacterium]|nr:polynucleotide adenylyltransferase PcnB [Deltaproteobacteria bacterium]
MLPAMQPLIIPRKEHRISRKKINRNVLRTLYRLHDNGFIAYLIGGCVRDLLLERTPKDFDIATDARPGQIKRLFRNCRLIGRRFRLAHLHFADEILEVSTFRADALPEEPDTESPAPNNHNPRHLKDDTGMVLRDNVFGTPEQDALRRDFTINALAYNIADFSVIDYTTGLADLRDGIIRPIGDPYVRFTEDPVRMLRAVRFAASHHFVIEPATWKTLCELSSTISRATPGRLYEEMLKLFLFGAARPAFGLMHESGLLAALFSRLVKWLGENTDRLNIMNENLGCLDQQCQRGISPSPALFFAAFFGPLLAETALAGHREGIPIRLTQDAVCGEFISECSKTVSIPGKVVNQLRNILALQHVLHKVPPRRPSVIARRPEFSDALAYLHLAGESKGANSSAAAWWDSFLSGEPSPIMTETPADAAPAKRRRRRKRRRRPAAPADTIHG